VLAKIVTMDNGNGQGGMQVWGRGAGPDLILNPAYALEGPYLLGYII